jgi:hypothetical protein
VAVTRLSGGNTPADGADPRTFPAIWNGTADDLEAGEYSKVPSGGSAGEVLVKQSGTDFDLGYGVRAFPYALRSEQWHGAISNTTVTQAEALFVQAFYVSLATSFSELRIEVTSAGEAGSKARLGVYGTDANGNPSALIVDAGTVLTDTTGIKSIVISQTLQGLVWLACGFEDASATRPTVRGTSGIQINPIMQMRSNSLTVRDAFLSQSYTAGSLPSTFTGTGIGLTFPTVHIKAA